MFFVRDSGKAPHGNRNNSKTNNHAPPEQITALARELADSLYNDDKAYNTILWWCEEPKERKAEELECTIRFLLRRFCLVEKSKVDKDGLDIAWRAKEYGTVILSKENIYYLFPEIAKEVK